MQWLIDNALLVVGVLLGISEALALLFPPQTGFGGILQGLISFLRRLRQPPQP